MKEQYENSDLSEEDERLVEAALQARKNAYAPYSGYKVGAALKDIKGNVHTGCNVESADLTLTSHAEMVAIDSMVKSGTLSFVKIAVALKGNSGKPALPCGLCRQKMSEFDKDGNAEIISVNLDSQERILSISKYKLSDLLPFSFSSEYLAELR